MDVSAFARRRAAPVDPARIIGHQRALDRWYDMLARGDEGDFLRVWDEETAKVERERRESACPHPT